MTDPTQSSIFSPATADSPSRSRPSEWPTPAAMNPQDGESVESWDARRELVKAKGINGNGMGEPLTIAVLRFAPSASRRSTPTPAPSSRTDGLMSPTSAPFSASPEIQSLSDAVSSRLSSLVAFLASRTAWPASERPVTTNATSGPSVGESFGIYDHASRCSRTSQACLPLSQELFSTAYLATWPRFGTLASGTLYRQPTLARPIDASASGSSVSMNWPTAIANDAEKRGVPKVGAGLAGAVHLPENQPQAVTRDWPTPTSNWPTATASDAHTDNLASTQQKDGSMHSVTLPQAVTRDWPTASARDYKDTPGMAMEATNPDGSHRDRADQLARVVYQETERSGPLRTDGGLPVPVSGSTGGSRVESLGNRPTPAASTEHGGAHGLDGGTGARSMLSPEVTAQLKGGKLSPAWVECLMGLPMGHTQLPYKFTKPRRGTP